MVSLTYSLFRGFIGIFVVGLFYVVFDEVRLFFHNLAIDWQLSGDMLAWLDWGYIFLVISITLAFLIGVLVKAYIARNQ